MNSVLDDSLVGLALIVSAGYALASLGPRILRRRLLALLSQLIAHIPKFLGLQRAAQRLAVASSGKAQGACGGCDSCGPGETPAPNSPRQPASEVRVPVAKIGRRA